MSDSFGDLVRRGREEAGLSQSRLATLVGRSATTIRAWEHGRTSPSDRQSVAALAAVLGLDENELLDQAGFEATQARTPVSARQELNSLASERTEMIALIDPDPQKPDGQVGSKPAGSSRPPRPKHASPKHSSPMHSADAADVSTPTGPAPEDEVVEMPIIKPPTTTPGAPAGVTVSKGTVPKVPVPAAPVSEAPMSAAPMSAASMSAAPMAAAPMAAAPMPAPLVSTGIAPSVVEKAPTTREKPEALQKSPLATKAKPRVVLTHRMAPGPAQAASNGFVSGISYIEDEDEKDFYRRRGAITAIVLAFMVIVIWWAFGRTGSAIGDFFESIIGSFDI